MAPQFQRGVGEFRPYTSSFREMAIRAMEEALHQRLIDRGRDEIQEVFERPDVKAAEAVILRALAEMFAPKPERMPPPRKARRRPGTRKHPGVKKGSPPAKLRRR